MRVSPSWMAVADPLRVAISRNRAPKVDSASNGSKGQNPARGVNPLASACAERKNAGVGVIHGFREKTARSLWFPPRTVRPSPYWTDFGRRAQPMSRVDGTQTRTQVGYAQP